MNTWSAVIVVFSISLGDGTMGHWGTKPLGPKVEAAPFQPAPVKRQPRPTLKGNSARGAEVVLVREGQPACVLMVADQASAAAREAAVVLRDGLKKMSSADVPIVKESELTLTAQGDQWSIRRQGQSIPYLVAIGDTKLSASQGLSGQNLALEGYRIKTAGNVLLRVGSDVRSNGNVALDGSRHAAVALLERHLGCRWLWPGELGEIVPRNSTVKIPPLDEQDAPAIRQRTLPIRPLRRRPSRLLIGRASGLCRARVPLGNGGDHAARGPSPDRPLRRCPGVGGSRRAGFFTTTLWILGRREHFPGACDGHRAGHMDLAQRVVA